VANAFLSIARRQGGAITRAQLAEAGVDRHRLARMVARGELIEVQDHVFLSAGAPPTWNQRAWVRLLEVPGPAVLSHRTAARLHRAGRFSVDHIDVLVLESGWHRPVSADRHRTTWLPPDHVATVDGLPVTTLARTIFDLCGLVSQKRRVRGLPSLTEKQVARAMDDGIARTLTVAQLSRVLGALGGRGRPGTVLMRRLLEERCDGYVATESELEDLLIAVLTAYGVALPVRQVPLGDADDRIGRVDFVYPVPRVVVEADGRRHHSALLDAEADRWRDLELAAAGFVVLRVTWHQLVYEPQRFIAALRKVLAARTPALETPTSSDLRVDSVDR
jgi:very-short-patch-repair endonuclease